MDEPTAYIAMGLATVSVMDTVSTDDRQTATGEAPEARGLRVEHIKSGRECWK
jgi:hypothetical protein